MNEDDIDVHVVDGLGLSMQRGDPCFLVFCKSRNMNDAYESWYWDTVVMPYIDKIRTAANYNVKDYPCAVNCDGEDRQIMVLANEKRQRELVAANVIVDKPSSSTTEITQSCDQELFLTKNNFLKDTNDDQILTDDFRFVNLSNAFAEHQTKEANKNRLYKGISSPHVRQGIFGTLRVAIAFSKTCTLDRAVKCNEVTGQRPFDPDKMINNLFVHMENQDRQHFKVAIPEGSKIYATNGSVTSQEMDDLHVPDNDDEFESNIDNLTMSRRRSTRLTVEQQWRVILKQKETRESSKRKKAQKDENRPPKIYRPYKPQAKKQKR
jgi:hypothetical protein